MCPEIDEPWVYMHCMNQVVRTKYFNVRYIIKREIDCLFLFCFAFLVWLFCFPFVKGELRPEISLLHMEVLTLIKAKSNVSPCYVQWCSCTRRSKTKILTTRAPPSWIEFDVVTSTPSNATSWIWLVISMFLRLLISCKSQKNRLRVSSNRFK